MADEVASLQIKVDSKGVVTCSQNLDGLVLAGKAAEKTNDKLATSFRRLVGPIAGVVSAAAGLRKLVEVNREFDKLEAGLITSTGSAKEAAKAMGALQAVAAKTPNSVRDTVDAFNRLVNYGLEPSEKALISYGNTSAAMGKTLTQMIEAVADAATGEFERLKEFGIKARQQNDSITFTFRGVSTTVKKTSKEIQGYLLNLGETAFAGAMEERMKTLDGAISNLGDAWDKLFRDIGKTDVGELMKDMVNTAQDALRGLSRFLQSDEMSRSILAIRKIGIDIAYAVDKLGGVKQTLFALTPAGAAWKGAKRAYQSLEDIWTGEDLMKPSRKNPEDIPGTPEWKRKQSHADLDREYLNNRILAATPDSGAGLGKYAKGGDGKSAKTAKKTSGGIEFFRRDEAYLAYAEMRRNEERAGREALNQLRADLSEEEDKVYAEFAKKRQLVIDALGPASTAADPFTTGSDEVLKKLYDALAKELHAIEDAKQQERDALTEGLLSEEEEIERSYARREKAIVDAYAAEIVTAEQMNDILGKLDKKRADDAAMRNAELVMQSLDSASAIAGNFAQIAKGSGKEQSEAYRQLFAVQKGFATASATIAMFQAISKGLEKGFPLGIPDMLLGASKGAEILAGIKGMQFSGAYDRGGFIPAGGVGLVGERGPELVRGPAQVTGRDATAAAMGPQAIRLIVADEVSAAMKYRNSAQDERAVIAIVGKNAGKIRRMVMG